MKISKSTFIRFMGLMEKRLPIYLIAILIMTITRALVDVYWSMIYKDFCMLAEKGTMNGGFLLIGKKVLIAALFYLVTICLMRLYNIEGKRATANVQKVLFAKAMKLPMSYYENHHSGDMISKLINDTQYACHIYTGVLRRFVAPVISVLVYLVPMFYLCPQLTSCLLFINLIALGFNALMVKPMKDIGVAVSKINSKMAEALSNVLQGIDVIKMYDINHMTIKHYKEVNKSYVSIRKKEVILTGILEGMNACLNLVCALAFLAVGVIFVEKGITTVGNLAAIYTMYGMFSWHFLQIGRCYPVLMNCIAYAERIFEFLAQDEEPEGYEIGEIDTSGEEEKSYIDFKHLTFSYDKERMILDDVSLQLKKGKVYALTGETGKGKSTIAKLLLGFYPLDKGNIYIEGIDMNVSGLKKIRDMIAYVPQEPYLFNMSIKENIRYGKIEATDEEIIAAAKIANAHEFILNQAEGYDTLVGERGNNLSGGERQRIAIARAILKNAPILLLDEATSALDNESEQLVQEALNRLMANRTTIMIAHRHSTIALADEEIHLV